ncbi:MAG: permease, partial [Acidimicrobiales bacterium]
RGPWRRAASGESQEGSGMDGPEPVPSDALSGGSAALPGEADAPARPSLGRSQVVAVILFLAVAVAGTYLVKWHPYYLKGFKVAASHSMGASIVGGHGAAAPEGWSAALDYAYQYGKDIWQALVVGLLVGAGVQELLPRDWLLAVLGEGRFRCTALGGLIALPSMMCTCCSAPPTVSMARARASVGATMAYWLGNPVLNPATLVFMAIVLGWRWALLRVAVGLLLVLGVASLAQRLFGQAQVPDAARQAVAESQVAGSGRPLTLRYLSTLGRLCVGLIPEYALVVLALGAARAFLFPTITPGIGHAAWLVIVLAVTGTLFVIPTAAEVPIIQAFVGFGLAAGGAGALLVTLPAVSLPSLVMVGRAVPSRVLAFVAGAVVVAGLLTAGLAAAWGL